MGEKRIFVFGVIWFALASLVCGLAPNIEVLVAARAVQGVGGALLTPGSLAIISASFRREDRMRAIGAWSGLGGIAGAAAPFLGGWIIQTASWRWIFLINLPVAIAVVAMAARHVPESRDARAAPHTDVVGAALAAVGLAALTYGLITWAGAPLVAPKVWAPLLVGMAGLAAFLLWESRTKHPMLPLGIFSSRLFSATNVVTFLVYAALGGLFFWLVLHLQVVVGFAPLQAGLALLPLTLLMLALSARAGALSERTGARLPMTVGPILAAVGAAGLTRIEQGSSYLLDVAPPVTLFGLGLVLTVAPLTATVLAAVPDSHAGLASGVNNAVARVASLIAVAALPVVAGLGESGYGDPAELAPAFRTAMWVCAACLLVGGLLSAAFVRTPQRSPTASTAEGREAGSSRRHCATDSPPLSPVEETSAES